MHKLIGSGTASVLMVIAVLGLSACAKHEEPAPVAALPPAPPPPPPVTPPAPTADDLLEGQLAQTGAVSSNGGWSVTLSSGRFHAGKVAFSPQDQATLDKIAALLKANPLLRLQIENYLDKQGTKTRMKEQSQIQANAVLRQLTASGADQARLQAQGEIDSSKLARVEIIFSNAQGEFRPAPVENS